jgi:hypothetical protein
MKTPEDMTLGQRIMLTFFIVLVILFALALFGWTTGRWDEAPAESNVNLYGNIPPDPTLLQLDRLALDEAYHTQLIKLWTVWLSTGAGDATHFRNGLANARRAYGLAAEAIAKREQH